MAQIDKVLYNSIADAYDAIDTGLSGVAANARVALNSIVDVDTATYPIDNPSANDVDAALEIELALLTPFNTGYIQSLSIASNIANLLDAVRSVNNHVISNGVGADSQTKLDTWINVTMLDTWTGGACPSGWRNISEDAGYDTSNWSV